MSAREIDPASVAARSDSNSYSSTSPICGLPSEILSNIFLSLKDIDPPWVYHESETEKKKHLGFIQVTFVCQRFRETAIATPRLWSHIAFELGPEWMITMMERAMAAPIFLWAHCRDDSSRIGPEVKAYVPKHIFHLQELTLSGPEDEVAYLSSCLTEPAPMLELLSLRAQTFGFYSPEPPIPIPPILFDGQTPRLSRLTLNHCIISWDCPNFKSLTSLRLSLKPFKAYGTTEFLPSMSQLLDLIDQNPLLTILSLEYCLPYLDSPIFPLPSPTRVGKLVHLADFTLAGRVLDCVQVLECLSVPVTASIHISCHAWNRTDPSIRDGKEACDLLPSLTRHISPLKNEAGSHGPFTKLYILPHDSFTKPGSVNVCLEGSIEGSPISWDLSLPVAFPSVWNYIQTLNAVFDALPCTKGIKELSLVYCEFAYHEIIALFRNMQNVDTLSISNIGDQTLDPIAVALDTMTFDENGTLVFFPCLKDVSVYSGNSTFFSKLQKCLGNRKQRGSELEKIEFRGCTVTAFQVDTFRDVVKAVYWDEVEQPVT
ncbi:hypothetical protein BDP27DRAFT_1303047 [Rhodocollybia butyracea]|uniref:F-box domain-containing protein n=1 Tax=Rhodocollybia butyracea TaxID=206335 RepID=A0A9P5TY98_9AGAR|nr:hypothetical protein BDP27DRAFT_1303047 [Rhodocollybia butyracea]